LLFAGSLVAGVSAAIDQSRQIGQLFKAAPQPLLAGLMVGMFFLLMLAIATDRLRLRQSGALTTAGAISYPLYLLHSELGRRFFVMKSGMPEWIMYMTGLAGIHVVAWSVTAWGESPVRHWFMNRKKRARTALGGTGQDGRSMRLLKSRHRTTSPPSHATTPVQAVRVEQDSRH
jgi:peptidoglycan/LPS O-acetylase OafA/YrhL